MSEKLRLDFSVECEECGQSQDIPTRLDQEQAQQSLRDEGWRLIDDANHCPLCVAGKD